MAPSVCERVNSYSGRAESQIRLQPGEVPGYSELLEGTYPETYCTFPLARKAPGNFVDGIRSLMPTIEGLRNYLKEIKDSGGRSELFVGAFVEGTSGFVLDVNDMSELADMSLDLSVEYYF